MFTRVRPAPIDVPLPPPRVLLLDGPAAGREVPGSSGTLIRLIRHDRVLVYERAPDAATALYVGEV